MSDRSKIRSFHGLWLSLFVAGALHAQEFDFKGAVLGMPLTDFQALPPIEGKLLRDGSATSCKPSKGKEDAALGKLECMRAGDDPFGQKYGYTSPNYYFAKDAAGVARLYMILIMSKRDNYAEAVLGLTQKWGEGKVTKASATNGAGQEIPKESVLWKRASSEIALEVPCTNVRYMCISYEHKLLAAEASKTGADAASKF